MNPAPKPESKPDPDPILIRRNLADRILKNLIQAQGYVEQLENELEDPRYDHLVGDRSEWEAYTRELLDQLQAFREQFEEFHEGLRSGPEIQDE